MDWIGVSGSGNSNYNNGVLKENDENDNKVETANSQRKKKGVRFEGVKIYLFERVQGFDTVPSHGGYALGMRREHFGTCEVKLEEEEKFDHQLTFELQRAKIFTKRMVKRRRTSRSYRKRPVPNIAHVRLAVPKRPKLNEDSTAVNDEKSTASEEKKERINSEGLSSDAVESEPSGASEHVEYLESGIDDIFNGFRCNVLEGGQFRPLSRRNRYLKLKGAGVKRLDKEDTVICAAILESRSNCGCSCGIEPCTPDTCECAKNEIECLVDRPSFPCSCTAVGCKNPFGRREFNSENVRLYCCSTIIRSKAAESLMLDDFPMPVHIRFEDV